MPWALCPVSQIVRGLSPSFCHPALQGRARSDGAHAFRERAQADRQRGFLVQQVDDGDCRQYVVYLVIARKVQFQVENFVVAVALDAEFLEIPFRRMVDAREIVFGIDDFWTSWPLPPGRRRGCIRRSSRRSRPGCFF